MEIPKRDTPTGKILKDRPSDFPNIDRQAVQTCMDFMRVAKKAMATFYDHFASYGISPGKYSVLMEFAALPVGSVLSPSDIADRIGVTRPTITGLIDGMVRQGLIERNSDGNDRRKVTVTLTSQGVGFIRELMPIQFERMASISSELTSGEQNELCRLLSGIEAGTDRLNSELVRAKMKERGRRNG